MVSEKVLRRKLQKKLKRLGYKQCPMCNYVNVRGRLGPGQIVFRCPSCRWVWFYDWTGQPG